MSGRESIVGYVTQSLSPVSIEAVSETPVPIGTYVYIEFEVRDRARGSLQKRSVVGVVTNVGYQPAVPLSTLALIREDTDPSRIRTPRYSPMTIYVIADVTEEEASSPIYPVPPNTPIYSIDSRAPSPIARIYKSPDASRGYIRIGSLARLQDIDIAVDVNRLYKHLLITGATGSGKSNAVAIIADRLSMLGAPVVIFDVHGEYVNLEPEDGRTDKVDVVRAEIDPLNTSTDALTHMVIREPQAFKQRRFFKRLLRELIREIRTKSQERQKDARLAIQEIFDEKMKKSESVLTDLADEIYGVRKEEIGSLGLTEKFVLLLASRIRERSMSGDKDIRKVYESIEEKFIEFVVSYPILNIDAVDPLSKIRPGRIVVYDVSTLNDDQKSWMLKLLAERLLETLKKRYREERRETLPTVLVVEEAPLFISTHTTSVAKESLRRFAREGRKFGGVLILASQRPRTLDPDISSQIQNFLFLKLVQLEDIRTVMSIADNLEESLARTLPSLPTGWGILMGEWVGRFPALVAVDRHRGKRLGASPDLVSEWRAGLERVERRSLTPSEFQF